MKFFVLSLFMILLSCATYSQQEISLAIEPSKKSSRPMGTGIISAIDLKVMKATPDGIYNSIDDGVVILEEYGLYKFDSKYQLLFKSDLTEVFQFPKLGAYTSVVSDELSTFVLEVKKKSSEKVSVIFIDKKGQAKQQSYEIDINDNSDYTPFILNGKLCVLGSNIDGKSDKLIYKYYHIDPNNGQLITKTVDLPTDEYEYKQVKKEGSKQYYWKYVANHGQNVILIKSYFKKIEGSKKYKFVCELAEVDMHGNVTDNKSITFEPKFAGDDREFFAPRVVFNKADGSISLIGFMEIDRKKINGLYILKYDYNSASLIYNKEFTFTELMKPEVKKNTQVHYEIPERVREYYPLMIRHEDIMLDHVNNFVGIRIITDYDFGGSSFFEVYFDKYGDHIKSLVTKYPAHIAYYGNFTVIPSMQQSFWVDTSRPHVTSAKPAAWDYIGGKTHDKKSRVVMFPVSTTQGNSVIKYNSDDESFAAIILP